MRLRWTQWTLAVALAAPLGAQELLVCPEAYLKASNTGTSDLFGISIAASGDTVIVGASGESSSANTIDGDQTLNDALATGAAYVFVRSGTNWTQQSYLKASDSAEAVFFGQDVALDGDRVVIGAPRHLQGTAYVFERIGTSWQEQAQVSGEGLNDWYGSSLGLSGTTFIVGAHRHDESAYEQDSGAAYVYSQNGTSWTLETFLQAPDLDGLDWYGFSVAIDGDTLAIGAPKEDSNASGIDGNGADDSAPDAGATYVYVRSGTNWVQEAYLKASNTDAGDEFGRSVSLAGDTLVVSAWLEDSVATGVGGNQNDDTAPAAGAAYVFVRSGTTWSQQAYLKASNPEPNDRFGSWVDLDGDRLVVGAQFEDGAIPGVDGDQSDNFASNAGAAYLFERSGTTWAQVAYLKASNPGTFDQLSRMALTEEFLVCSTSNEDSKAIGIDGDWSDNSLDDAGAAYAFSLQPLPAPQVYCTAKRNSDGCVPTMGSNPGPPLTLRASLILPGKNGLLFYGLAGPAAVPFLGGTLCVAPPLRRTVVLKSFGTGAPCSGAFSFDLDTWILGGNDPLLVPGTQLNAQYWYRDPLDPVGVGLTDGLELFLGKPFAP